MDFWKRADADLLVSMIGDATQTNMVGLDALVIGAMDRLGVAQYSHAIEYLGRVGQPESIPAIGKALDNDGFGKCDPFYCAFALQTQGGWPESRISNARSHAIDRVVSNWQKELVCSCVSAIEEIRRRNAGTSE